MNAIEFLISEHDRVRKMLEDIADEAHHFETRQKQFELLARDLIRHEHMEHTVWYPHFKEHLPDLVTHLIKEEQTAEKEINKILELKTETAWLEHFSKFKKDVSHHAKEEEEKLFPEVEKILSITLLHEIGAEMAAYKKA